MGGVTGARVFKSFFRSFLEGEVGIPETEKCDFCWVKLSETSPHCKQVWRVTWFRINRTNCSPWAMTDDINRIIPGLSILISLSQTLLVETLKMNRYWSTTWNWVLFSQFYVFSSVNLVLYWSPGLIFLFFRLNKFISSYHSFSLSKLSFLSLRQIWRKFSVWYFYGVLYMIMVPSVAIF